MRTTLTVIAASSALLLALVTSVSATEPHLFVGPAKCKTCHGKDDIGNQLAAWQGTAHARAYATLATPQAKEWAEARGITGDPQQAPECVKCHITAWDAPETQLGSKYLRTDGVGCESCHGAGNDYKKKAIMVDRDQAVANGMAIPDEALCVTCHNDESPAWNPTRYGNSGFNYKKAVKKIPHAVPDGYDPYAE